MSETDCDSKTFNSLQAGSSHSSKIPRLFHFIFGLQPRPQPLHLIHYLCLESCIQINRPEKVYFYCHQEPYGKYWERIKHQLSVVYVDLVPEVLACDYQDKMIRKKLLYAHHSDFVRIEQLNYHGGIYADLDTIFVRELPAPLFEKPFVMGEEPPVLCHITNRPRASVCNALIMAERQSYFGSQYYELMASRLDGSWSNHSCFLARELSEKFPAHIHLEPQNSFYKHIWTREGIDTLLLGCDPNFEGVYSMHLWAHLWWSKQRKDFSNFHAGRMTESFIRSVDTTYNIVARKFLPPVEKRRFFRRFSSDGFLRLTP